MPAERAVDVRPGAAASYAGHPVQLPLVVTGAGGRTRVAWTDPAELEATVTEQVAADDPGVVRFAERAGCRQLIGPDNTAAIERRLADTAAQAGVPLVTWTTTADPTPERARYDVVVRATAVD